MPLIESPPNELAATTLQKFSTPPITKEELQWADLIQLDLSEFDKGPDAQAHLAKTFLESAHTTGFLYIVNHGISPEMVAHHADIANTILSLPEHEKAPYYATKERAQEGRFTGFKPAQLGAANGLHPTIDHYNFPRFHSEIGDEMDEHMPQLAKEYMSEAKELSLYLHKVVCRKLLILIAIALKVPLDTYTNLHTYEAKCESFLRYMKYEPRTEEDNEKYKDLYLPGHADWGSLTFLFNQPITALQILDPQDNWKHVKYMEGSIIVNVGEALSHLTGGYLKPTVHRVVKPPKDQENYRRISLIYFVRPFDTCPLVPPDSPVLKEKGYQQPTETMTMAQYASARYGGYRRLNYDNDKPGAAAQGPHTMRKV
ncbi:Gibberellin 2-oxidase [Pleurostoma richardsiae]|uniref:Gibberellin 2-oxidase n=1 Tax=Pleurostoma richardsiae TaxID=41990 RepID=A0AA38RVA5_9PEZI|nr:Gibberellin 2-oxidase [Pleurostoma richardsiae]